MKKCILGGHPVALVGQAKDFHQHHILCFPLPCTEEKNLLEHLTHPLQWSAVMSSHAAFMASNRDIWSCALWSTDIYTGAGHIIRISPKSWFISLIPFKKWNLYNVHIHSTQTDIFQVFISFNFDDYNWQLMKTQNSVSQKIRILLKTNTKKGFLEILANWKVWTWKVWACTALNT